MHPLLNDCRRRGGRSPSRSRRLATVALPAVLLVLAAWAGDTAAQERVKAELLQLYGGVYSNACVDSDAPRLRISPDALVVQNDGQRLIGRKLRSANPFGTNAAPPQFRTALTGEATTGGTVEFIVMEDRRGLYVTVPGDGRVQALLGKSAAATRYRRCDDPAAQAVARPTPPIPAQDEPASETEKMLLDEQFKSSYLRALGPLARDRWLAQLEGPRPPTRQLRLDGNEYTVIAVCKAHACADHNTVLLYAATQATVFGKVFQAGQSRYYGDPSPALAVALDQIWATEWRRR
ncbi:MAG: hypothetical protein JWP29_988 [Rhodoferax sp.]|nr:hypothetical protein [Rhodoferax sp.]